jgi:3-oxoacid CoA-transferase subunit A
MAGAAKITVAEVEELVEAGSLDPNQIHSWNIQNESSGQVYEKKESNNVPPEKKLKSWFDKLNSKNKN